MKKTLIILTLLFAGIAASGQQYTGRKVTAIDSVVTDTIRARTQAGVWIQGLQFDPAGNNTEIQFNDNGAFGASSDLTWDGTDLGVTGSLTVDNLTLDGNTMSSSTGTIDLVPTGTQDVRITNGGDLILNNSSSRIVTPRIYTSSGGSSGAVSYYINNDENTGIYSGQADHLDIAAGGIDIINIDNTGIDVTGSLNVGNLTLDGNDISSSTGSIVFSDDLESSASVIDMNDNDIREIEDLGFSTSTSSNDIKETTSAISATAQDTGTDPIRRNNYYVLTPLSSVANRPLQTWANNSVDVMTLGADGSLDVTGNATFSGVVTTNDDLTIGNTKTGATTILTIKSDSSQSGRIFFDEGGTRKWTIGLNGSTGIFNLYNSGLSSNAFVINTSNKATFSGAVDIGNGLFIDEGGIEWNDNSQSIRMYSNDGTSNGYSIVSNVSNSTDAGLQIRDISTNVLFEIKPTTATFSGDIIASSGDIYLGASSPALTLSGGSDASSGGQIQLNGEGAGAASDIIFRIEGNEVGRYDSSQTRWEFDDVAISGSLSKGSGTFKITHPLDTGKWLYHSFVEAPRADNIYRGQVELYRGIARVGIDTASNMMEGTFDSLNQNVQVFVTNNDTWDRVRGYYSNGIIYIECQNELSRAVVDWLVIGERKDQTVLDWNLTDENGQLIPEWNKDND